MTEVQLSHACQVVLAPVLLLVSGRLIWRLVRWLKKGR